MFTLKTQRILQIYSYKRWLFPVEVRVEMGLGGMGGGCRVGISPDVGNLTGNRPARASPRTRDKLPWQRRLSLRPLLSRTTYASHYSPPTCTQIYSPVWQSKTDLGSLSAVQLNCDLLSNIKKTEIQKSDIRLLRAVVISDRLDTDLTLICQECVLRKYVNWYALLKYLGWKPGLGRSG